MNAVEAQAPTEEAGTIPRRSLRHWAALVAVAVMFFVVTKGPVFWVRIEQAVLTEPLLDDVWVQLAFVVPTAFVMAIAAPGARALWADRPVVIAFAAFVVAVLLSSIWSVNPSQTVEQTTMFVLGTAAALVAGAYLRRFDVLAALWLAMQVGVGISVFAWFRDWPGIIFNKEENFAGIFLSKNSFGPVAITGMATSIVLGVAAFRRRIWVLVPLSLVALVVDTVAWYESNSYTAALAVAVAVLGTVAIGLLVPGPWPTQRRTLGVALLVAGAAGAAWAVARPKQFARGFGRDTTLEGRTEIWDVVLDYAWQRPVQGWGFMAPWSQPEIIESLEAAGRRRVFEAHSGYLDVFLGVGLIGLVMLVVVCAISLARVTQAVWRAPSLMAAWSLALVIYVLVINVSETFIGPNLLPWTLLCVATGQAVAVLQRDRENGDGDGSNGADRPPDETVQPPDPLIEPIDATPLDLDELDWFDFSFDAPDEQVVRPGAGKWDDALERPGDDGERDVAERRRSEMEWDDIPTGRDRNGDRGGERVGWGGDWIWDDDQGVDDQVADDAGRDGGR